MAMIPASISVAVQAAGGAVGGTGVTLDIEALWHDWDDLERKRAETES